MSWNSYQGHASHANSFHYMEKKAKQISYLNDKIKQVTDKKSKVRVDILSFFYAIKICVVIG